MSGIGRINTALLVALFLPYVFGFAAGANIYESGLVSADKIIRLAVLYVSLIVLLLHLKNASLPRDLGIYFWPAALIFIILLFHYALYSGGDYDIFKIKKELFRQAALVVIFMICAIAGLRQADYRLLLYSLTAMGLVVGSLATWHSFTGESQMSWRYVAEFLRAGTEITDANILGAFLNVTTMAAIAGFFIMDSRHKVFFVISLLVIQVGRFFTFSTGSFYSIVISIIVAVFLLKKYDKPYFRRFLLMLFLIIAVLAVAIYATGMYDTLFYRIKFSDEYVLKASIYSRMSQYSDYLALIREEPSRLLYGYGDAGLSRRLSAGLTLHNSYLRPLATGGVVAFICFNFLCLMTLRNFMLAVRNSAGDMRVISIFLFAAFAGWSFQAATLPSDTSIIQWFFFMLGYMLGHTVGYKEPVSLSRAERVRPVGGA